MTTRTLDLVIYKRYDRVNMFEYDAEADHRRAQQIGYPAAGIGAAVMLAGVAPIIDSVGVIVVGAAAAVTALAVVLGSAYRLARIRTMCEATRKAIDARTRRQDQERREAEARRREAMGPGCPYCPCESVTTLPPDASDDIYAECNECFAVWLLGPNIDEDDDEPEEWDDEIPEWVAELREEMACPKCGRKGRPSSDRDIPHEEYDQRTAGEWLEAHGGWVCDPCETTWN